MREGPQPLEEDPFVPAREVLGYDLPVYEYIAPSELREARARRHSVVIVGGGLVGLSAALDLALRGIRVVLLDEDDSVGARGLSSRGVNYARRTLEIFERLGVDVPGMLAKGNVWKVHRTYYGSETVFAYDMDSEAGEKHPAMLALQQFHTEMLLVDRLRHSGAEIRWKNKVTNLTSRGDHVELTVQTPDGEYRTEADWVLACDGARSTARRALGLETRGEAFGRWFIADVLMRADYPRERHLWINPPFNPGRSALLIEMADGMWRTDMQMDDEADPAVEVAPERVRARLDEMLGRDKGYRIVWAGAYSFRFRCMQAFRHGRVLFLGDAAHENPPFGGRGGNSGVQDADNVAWKLELVLRGPAPERLLDTYDAERRPAALENIAQSSRSALFLLPRTPGRRLFRDAVIALAHESEFARKLVNSGRMSVPFEYLDSPLATLDSAPWGAGPRPGAAAPNAPVRWQDGDGSLLDRFRGRFTLLGFTDSPPLHEPEILRWFEDLKAIASPTDVLVVARRETAGTLGVPFCVDTVGLAFNRYGAQPGDWYLLRPDQHVAARWRGLPIAELKSLVAGALSRATGNAQIPLHVSGNALPEPSRRDELLLERLVAAYEGLDEGRRAMFLANLALLLAGRVQDIDAAIRDVEVARVRAGNWR